MVVWREFWAFTGFAAERRKPLNADPLGGRLVNSRITLALLLVVLSVEAWADVLAYKETVDLTARGSAIDAIHHHNWEKRESYVELRDPQSARTLFKIESPPLSTLWVSPDGLVVGLSSIKLDNATQVIVIDSGGRVLLKQSVRCHDTVATASCSESVSNRVYWYRVDVPSIEIDQSESGQRTLIVSAPLHFVCFGHEPKDFDSAKWQRICGAKPDRIRIPIPQRNSP